MNSNTQPPDEASRPQGSVSGGLLDGLLCGPDGALDRWLRVVWGIAVAARLTLPNALDDARVGIHLTLAVFAVGIVFFGGRLFYAGALLMLLLELLSGRDWLTQTMVMVFAAGLGVVFSQRNAPRAADALRWGTSRVVVLTYVFAVFHKLNRDFLNPVYSCATHGWRRLDEALFVELGEPSWAYATAPSTTIAVEAAIAIALLWRPRVALAVAPLFHIPLTLAIEPAFPFVMALGWVAAFAPEDRQALLTAARRYGVSVALVFVASTLAFAWLTTPDPAWLDAIKCGAMLAVSFLATASLWPAGLGATPKFIRGRLQAGAAVGVCLFAGNAATPYFGTQFQHTSAMLSNLRIDEGCWNHLVVPEWVRRIDPYIRIDEVSIGRADLAAADTFVETEALVLNTLWSSTALRSMRRNWCNERTRPIVLRGTFAGEPVHIDDLCNDAEVLPRGPGAYGGEGMFDSYLRLQKNLLRGCPNACVH